MENKQKKTQETHILSLSPAHFLSVIFILPAAVHHTQTHTHTHKLKHTLDLHRSCLVRGEKKRSPVQIFLFHPPSILEKLECSTTRWQRTCGNLLVAQLADPNVLPKSQLAKSHFYISEEVAAPPPLSIPAGASASFCSSHFFLLFFSLVAKT